MNPRCDFNVAELQICCIDLRKKTERKSKKRERYNSAESCTFTTRWCFSL